MYEDHRLKGHLYGIGYLKGDEPRPYHRREPSLASEQSSYVTRVSALEARLAKLEATLSELVLLGMKRAALEGE